MIKIDVHERLDNNNFTPIDSKLVEPVVAFNTYRELVNDTFGARVSHVELGRIAFIHINGSLPNVYVSTFSAEDPKETCFKAMRTRAQTLVRQGKAETMPKNVRLALYGDES